MVVSVFDVAKYILDITSNITAMKLQKLCYYSQAWSLVWEEEPLFSEDIQAWANGPVIPELYNEHKGQFKVSSLFKGDSNALTEAQKDTVQKVIAFYGKYNPQQLSDLTHMEDPWADARRGIPDGVRSDAVIAHASMAEYYSSIQ